MFSVIIPTYNAEECLEKLLKSLVSQTLKANEIIILDSSSTDNTIKIARDYTDNIHIIDQSDFRHGGARTKGARLARNEILLYLTQDVYFEDRNSIEILINNFKNKRIACAYGRQMAYDDTNIFGKHLRYYNYPDKSYIRKLDDKDKFGFKTVFISNSFAAYRKSNLKEIGWFKNELNFGEDCYAAAKLLLNGYLIAYSSDAKVLHSHSYSIIQEFKRYFQVGSFHKKEKWLIETFGKVQGEGIRYLKSEIKYLYFNGKLYLFINCIIRNAMKYLGYKFGYFFNKRGKE